MAQSTNLGQVRMNLAGEYSATKTYQRLDIVSYQGSSYIALKDTLNVLPTVTDNWMLNSSKGEKGNVYFATFEYDDSTSEIFMITPDEYEGPSFELTDGILYAVV